MIELVSDRPAPQFGAESSLGVRIRAGSRIKGFLCFVLIDVNVFMCSWLKATALAVCISFLECMLIA
jgi:hypothetical protein